MAASERPSPVGKCACGCGRTTYNYAKYADEDCKFRHQSLQKFEQRRIPPPPKPKVFKARTPMEERRASVRSNIREICKEYFNWDLQPFHYEVLSAMFDGGYLCVNLPTDHAKSTMGCFLFPLLSLMEDPNETHIICGANVNDSKRRVQALELEIETNKALTRDFPWIAKPDKDDLKVWSATQFNVVGRTQNKPNPSVLASAVGSNDVKGRRGKLLMDDIEGEDARWSPLKREQLYSWLKLEAWRCYEDRRESERPLLCLLGTPFDIDSIYFMVQKEGWKVIRYPVYLDGGLFPDVQKYNATGQPIMDPPREYLWPDKKEKVDRARRTLRKWQFSVAYLMDPTGGDPNKLSMEEIQQSTGEAEFASKEFTGFVSIDPASGSTNRQADYAGIVALRVFWPQADPLPEVEIHEAYNFTQGLFEQVHFCAELSRNYGYPVIYEINSQQGGVYQNTFNHLHPEVNLLRHYTTHQNKFDDAMGLSVVKTLITKHKLRIDPSLQDEEGIVSFMQEIRDLAPPFKKHNHISAAIWFAVRYCYEKIRHYKGPEIQSTYFKPYKSPFRPNFTAGYGPQQNEYEKVLQRERQKEYDRFVRALQGNRK